MFSLTIFVRRKAHLDYRSRAVVEPSALIATAQRSLTDAEILTHGRSRFLSPPKKQSSHRGLDRIHVGLRGSVVFSVRVVVVAENFLYSIRSLI